MSPTKSGRGLFSCKMSEETQNKRTTNKKTIRHQERGPTTQLEVHSILVSTPVPVCHNSSY